MASCSVGEAEDHMRISCLSIGGSIDAGCSVAWAGEKDGYGILVVW